MFKFLLQLWEAYGLDSVQIIVIVGLAWKFATNHWKHFTDKVDNIDKNIKANTKVINRLSNRVSKIEGKIEKR